jgi:hypothetical protein
VALACAKSSPSADVFQLFFGSTERGGDHSLDRVDDVLAFRAVGKDVGDKRAANMGLTCDGVLGDPLALSCFFSRARVT